MAKLSSFAHQASAETRLTAKRGPDFGVCFYTFQTCPSHLQPGILHAPQPQSRLLPVPHLVLSLRPKLRSFFSSQAPVSCWRLLMARCLRACRCRPWRFPCCYLSLSCRPMVWHRLLSRRHLPSLLLRVLRQFSSSAWVPHVPRGGVLLLRCPQLGRLSWSV